MHYLKDTFPQACSLRELSCIQQRHDMDSEVMEASRTQGMCLGIHGNLRPCAKFRLVPIQCHWYGGDGGDGASAGGNPG